ncbi:hypothetical protein ABT341_00365 [Pseudonocardia alni]|uniref:hypothetical protein n=1 Tax=Pseudonocardia alni TaxID=33907 RepID=UPI00332A3764
MNDPDFQSLSESAQRLYWLILAQKDLNSAGMLATNYTRWAKACNATSAERIRQVAWELHDRRYVLLDESTEEAFVRSLMRRDEIARQPQLLKNALRLAPQTDSPFLRHELAAELRRLGRDDASATADEIDPGDFPPPGGRSPIQADGSLPEGSEQGTGGVQEGIPDPGGVSIAVGGSLTSRSTQVLSSSDTAAPRPDKPKKPEPKRDDVEAVCTRLRDLIIENGSKAPTITQEWRRQARLMLDSDKRDLSKALNLIEWCQKDTFWQSNILSMPKFRQQYDQLALKAREEWRRRGEQQTIPQVDLDKNPWAGQRYV